MSHPENMPDMDLEDRLKAIAYQFIALYERWSEDRQIAAKQGADTAELVQLFTEQVKGFKELEPKVREQLRASIQQAFHQSLQGVNEKIEQAANSRLDNVTSRLNQAAHEATQKLRQHEHESLKTTWIFIVVLFVTCITVSFMVGRWAVPQPYLPLSSRDLQIYINGTKFDSFWPKLSKQEQNRLLKMGNQPQALDTEGSSETENTNAY